jgi:hypothetical protein
MEIPMNQLGDDLEIPVHDRDEAALHAGPDAILTAAILQQEIRRASTRQVASSAKTPAPKYTSGIATDWLPFKRQFVQVVRINGWDHARAKRQLMVSLGDTANTMAADMDSEDVNELFPDYLTRVENRFMNPADGQMAAQQFSFAAQRDKESTIQWHSRCRGLHTRAYMDVENREQARDLLQCFMIGIRNPNIRAKVSDDHPLTYAAALISASRGEATQTVRDGTQGRIHRADKYDKEMNAIASVDQGKRRTRPGTNRAPGMCWNCGQSGHQQKDCPKHKPWKTNPQQSGHPASSNKPWIRKGAKKGVACLTPDQDDDSYPAEN